jgi:hypothetical protein
MWLHADGMCNQEANSSKHAAYSISGSVHAGSPQHARLPVGQASLVRMHAQSTMHITESERICSLTGDFQVYSPGVPAQERNTSALSISHG